MKKILSTILWAIALSASAQSTNPFIKGTIAIQYNSKNSTPPRTVRKQQRVSEKGRVKALTLLPPWSSLVAINQKKWETRSWSTSYRGELAITASARWRKDDRMLCYGEPFKSVFLNEFKKCYLQNIIDDPECVPLGAVVAVATLEQILSTYDALRCALITTKEMAFGNYGPNRFGSIYLAQIDISMVFGAESRLDGLVWKWSIPECLKNRFQRQRNVSPIGRRL